MTLLGQHNKKWHNHGAHTHTHTARVTDDDKNIQCIYIEVYMP